MNITSIFGPAKSLFKRVIYINKIQDGTALYQVLKTNFLSGAY